MSIRKVDEIDELVNIDIFKEINGINEKPLDREVGRRSWRALVDVGVFALFLLIICGLSFYLFYQQAMTDESSLVYFSDMKVYVREMLGLEKDCFFPYRFYFQLGSLVYFFTKNPEVSMAFVTMFLNALSMVFVKLGFTKLHRNMYPSGTSVGSTKWLLGELWLSLMTFVLFMVSMIFPPSSVTLPGIKHQYLGVFSPTPWHNGTYLAARPFAILSFLWGVKLLDQYERVEIYHKNTRTLDKKVLGDYLFFALVLFLSVYTKPSYMIVHLGAAGLVMVYRMVRSRFQNFWPTIWLGLCYIPTFIELWYQFVGVYAGGAGDSYSTLQGESGIGFGFAQVWLHYTDNLFLCLLLAGAFPLLVLCFHVKELKRNSTFRFAWQIYAMGLLMNLILYEQGAKKYDFNFCWGYMYGLFFAFFACIFLVYQDLDQWFGKLGALLTLGKNKDSLSSDTGEKTGISEAAKSTGEVKAMALSLLARGILIGMELSFLLAHFVCGAFFFYKLLGGAKYD